MRFQDELNAQPCFNTGFEECNVSMTGFDPMCCRAAHKLEEEIWLREGLVVSVSPSMKIRNQKGQEISVAARSTRLDL